MDEFTIDFETFYAPDYSLSKMQTEEYVEDPRFETILFSIAKNDAPPVWFRGPDAPAVFSRIAWDNAVVRCHHTHFDGVILSHRYGVRPAQWKDTLAQGRMTRPWMRSHSLASMAKAFGLPDKGTEVTNALGKRLADFTPVELERYAQYCMHDTVLTRTMGLLMDTQTPPLNEYLIDMTVRMFTEPALVGNAAMMTRLHQQEIDRKAALLASAAIDKSIIMSGDKLADALLQLGVVAPRKISPATKKETWAFAKTDKAFTELLEHDDPQVQALVAARLGVKSTIAETRALTYLNMANRGPLRVYLGFWGAKTTGRYSGGNKNNWQNLPARGPAAGLREAIEAPDGHVLVVGDSSNIELRTVMLLAGQDDVLDKIRKGVDLYCDFASRLFGRVITKADKPERQLGKVAMLSLQYGAGAARFQEMVRQEARKNPDLQEITPERAQEIVTLYRTIHHKVVDLWNHCQRVVLPAIARGAFGEAVDVNGMFITQNDGFGRPGEPGVVYHDLKFDAKENEWAYSMGKERVRIFGPKIVENLCLDARTPVLTERGWVPLCEIRGEKVHDGAEFVTHSGIVFKGVKQVIEVDGVRMTPDHEVLTDEGWKAASLVQRPYRPDLRSADGSAPRGVEEREMALAFSVYLRERESAAWCEPTEGSASRRDAELRVHDEPADIDGEQVPRHEPAPGVRGVPQHDRPLPIADSPSVAQLRRTWHRGVRTMGQWVRGVLGGHGVHVLAGAHTGPDRQRGAVLARELPLGDVRPTGKQPPWPDRVRPAGAVPINGDRVLDTAVSLGQGVAWGEIVRAARSEKVTAKVWDILNCGPRNRFVVLGADGPFIVHNCQHAAMLVVMWQTARINRRYPVKLSVHDEAVCVPRIEEAPACEAYMLECLTLAPEWCRKWLPVAGEVGIGKTYADAK